jgi:hypothetical protein
MGSTGLRERGSALRPMPQRRFPPPWSVEDIGAAFVVKDSAGQKLCRAEHIMRIWHANRLSSCASDKNVSTSKASWSPLLSQDYHRHS